MKTIGHHFTALQWTLQQFGKGKFLLYFIPGLLVAYFFWWLNNTILGWTEGTDPEGFWGKIVSGTGYALSATTNFIMVFFILTILSPINTFLSESVDTELTGKVVGFDLMRFINDFIRMIFVVFIAIVLEFLFSGIWWFLDLFLPLDFLSPVVYFLIVSFFYGFSFYDYSLERYEIGIGGSFRFSKKYFLPTLVTGIFFMGMYYIPVVGIAIAPVVATILSTHVFLKTTGRLDKEQKETQPA
jgi:CysZ protein